MTESLDDVLKRLKASLSEEAKPEDGEDLPEYEPIPEDEDETAVTFIKKG